MNAYRWTDLREGMSHTFEVELTAQMMSAFEALSGDVNPLHADNEFARKAGFPGVVAFGLLTSSFYSQLAGVYLPGRFCLLQGIDVDFVNPAFVGDKLSVTGTIAYLNEAFHRAEIKATIHNGAGQLISKAKIRAGVHERE